MKIDLDLQLTLMASGLYRLLAVRLGNGKQNAESRTLFRNFVKAPADITIGTTTASTSGSGAGRTTRSSSTPHTTRPTSPCHGSRTVGCGSASCDRIRTWPDSHHLWRLGIEASVESRSHPDSDLREVSEQVTGARRFPSFSLPCPGNVAFALGNATDAEANGFAREIFACPATCLANCLNAGADIVPKPSSPARTLPCAGRGLVRVPIAESRRRRRRRQIARRSPRLRRDRDRGNRPGCGRRIGPC